MNKKNPVRVVALSGLLITCLHAPVSLAEQGDWIWRARGIAIMPDDSSDQVSVDGLGFVQDLNGNVSSRVNVNSAIVPEFDLTYMLTDNLGLEVIAGIANHDVRLQDDGLGALVSDLTAGAAGAPLVDDFRIFDVWVLPPTITLQYHFSPDTRLRPYAGVGVNYTATLWDDATDELEAAVGGAVEVNTRNDWTYALQLGFDYELNSGWLLNVDMKYIDIGTQASLLLEGGPLAGTRLRVDTDISPYILGIGFGRKF